MIEIFNRKKLALSLYEKMEDNEMLFSYFGVMNFEITQYLINNLKASINIYSIDQLAARKLYSSLVEGMENIFKHRSSHASESDNNGIVMLTKSNDKYCLTLGNTVTKEQERNLLENIDELKDESVEDLKKMYKDKLRETDDEQAESASLGLIQIAINCQNSLHYDFLPMNHRINNLFLLEIFID